MPPASNLEIRDLTRRFGARTAVQGINLVLRPGELCGFLGPNGAGKSTIMRMLVGLLPPTRGEVTYAGRSIYDDLPAFRSTLGYVPEEPLLYNHLSASEFLELVGGIRRIPAALLARRAAGMLDVWGFGSERDSPMRQYSKGMKQKVLISAALLHDPSLLILDEPLSGLDVNAVQLMRELVKLLAAQGKLVLYCSHLLPIVATLCTRAIVLHQGRLVADGPAGRLHDMTREHGIEEAFARLTQAPDFAAQARDIVQLCCH